MLLNTKLNKALKPHGLTNLEAPKPSILGLIQAEPVAVSEARWRASGPLLWNLGKWGQGLLALAAAAPAAASAGSVATATPTTPATTTTTPATQNNDHHRCIVTLSNNTSRC